MTISLREQHKRQTADHLVEVAWSLFEREGFDSVSIEQIAAEAGISARTFYRYYPTKEAVLYPDTGDLIDALGEAISSAAPSVSPWLALRAGLEAMAATSVDRRDKQLRRSKIAQTEDAIDRHHRTVLIPAIEDVITDAFARRLDVNPSDDPRPRLLGGLGIALMSSITDAWTRNGGDVEGQIDAIFAAAASLASGTS